ncbi:RNA polymerase sigma factor [Luteimonas granuli]|uniref:Sigma-70 family RNA polymerase sigma factor n=1 Tax=Luteimonas granuli TaxID=1176533 RepID=A0A518N1T5_9GAMM|nr:sigma-70 family RNA polymerase sigma factor [Luteimonas granuli]
MLDAAMTDSPPAQAAHDAVDGDDALARAAAGGDTAAFEALYRRHAPRVHGVVLRLAGWQRARAEDLVQEAFLQAWRALPRWRGEASFGTWLYRLAVNAALMDLRARRARPGLDGDDEAALEALASGDSAQRTAMAMDLGRAVATLPPRARAVLVLHDVEGWTHDEIATALEMAVGSSKSQLHRARGLLRARLGDTP